MLEKVRYFPSTDCQAYFEGYLGNYYLILFFSDVWSYELFESYMPRASFNPTDKIDFTTDYEGFYNRKT